MQFGRHPDLGGLALGVAIYIALTGWFIVLPVVPFVVASIAGAVLPADAKEAELATRTALAVLVFLVCGYVAGRTSRDAPLLTAALLGVVLYVLATMLNGLLLAAFRVERVFDLSSEIASLVRCVVATFVGGVAALWQVSRRSLQPFDFRNLSRRMQIGLVAASIAPFFFLALTFRP
jgi:hypothetical protein